MAAKTSKNKTGKKAAGKPEPPADGDNPEDIPEVPDGDVIEDPGTDSPDGDNPEDQPVADEPTPARRPLARNVNIDGVWYGPGWGNADEYPADWHGLRDSLFETG